ncbi:MAG TPA: hypothetical protein VNZ26_06300 [Vicinamibacterales bacterium]|nr:hypothetical protein [Vicinamibacterales bacterium]
MTVALLLCSIPRAGLAQESPWSWTYDGAAFFGLNDQQRKFTDFNVWESQNWFALTGDRPLGSQNRLIVRSMLSLEPFTLEKLGSPEVFQTGETYKGRPLIDYQHPHDLLMGLGATYRVEGPRVSYAFSADLVGSPALGPVPFMHRASGADNPTAPLTHHYMDSTHITPGVLTAGVEIHERGGLEPQTLSVEASWFRGEEPDDDRLNIDRPRLDSWSTRLRWRHGAWDAQVSGAHLHRPEPFELYDMTRLTASVAYDGLLAGRQAAWTLSWGENREIHGNLDGYLFEGTIAATSRGSVYGRAELVEKDLLNLGGPDPSGFIEFHPISRIGAITIGYLHDVSRTRWGRVGIGGDLTTYRVPANLADSYGSPHSFHLFIRWRAHRSEDHHRGDHVH